MADEIFTMERSQPSVAHIHRIDTHIVRKGAEQTHQNCQPNSPFQFRRPKAEIRKKAETRIPTGVTSDYARLGISGFGVWISDFFRPADFGLRISNASD
jgi:hypothetical protein